MADPVEILRSTFGFAGFRGVQDQVVGRVMRGANTLAVMPTGAGKSLCYQVPSLALEGTCVVVSPLIALMHDQLRAAEAVGIRAATLTSVDENREETIQRFRAGQLDLLYVAPERASSEHFRNLLSQARLSLFAIDEAHCVSEWGHDFRPDYRLLRPLLDRFEDVPRLALTATADAHTRADICEQLGIPHEGMIVAGFDRPNIRYTIQPRENTTRQVMDVMADNPGPGIVYVQTRAGVEKLAEKLAETGRPVLAYHAGLDPQVRRRNQAAFVASEDMVIVATVAFGMGIDKPDVRFVAHAGLPKSIEGYYQETGRAGRDGDPAVAHLFWGADDFARARQRIGEVETGRQPGERARLTALGALVETAECRRRILLRHFGEEDTPEQCGNCDNCLSPPAAVDAGVVAQKFLSAVFRTGMMFGTGYIESVLLGQSSERSLMNGHEKLSVFGIVSGDEAALLKPVSRALLLRDALRTNAHGGLEFGPAAKAILKGETGLKLVLPPKRDRRGKRGAAGGANPIGNPLFEALRAKRREIAQETGLPPYVIFHDSVLRDMAMSKPTSLAELGRISGVGARKLDAYGSEFLLVIREAA
ncbi:DNA helicase RecQ [Sphingomonas xinjiangensis]|uniref:DNA helicase RecQ n=1 Tax=Sphingomonas xinjiangensis TaxID=643568 RepID=A0A840YMW5_9SPHN|nr:DNA helicase RecQ [Sphingomonas xinjiangensis]MBB5711090.1 ATP-dependent DNA helicase RecQ [Sphingomonas xinjiangensis]